MKKAVKIRSVEEHYVRFLIFQLLDREKCRKVSILLRRMDWATQENMIFRVIYKYLIKGKEIQVKSGCLLLESLKQNRPDFVNNIVESLIEELRVCFEKNDFNDNQHKVHICFIFAHLYLNNIVDEDLIFEILYMIVTYNPEWEVGRREIVADNVLDLPRDSVRIIMVITILDNTGSRLKENKYKDVLESFVHYFQIYILSKVISRLTLVFYPN